jgi:thymidylate synthase (FAD)
MRVVKPSVALIHATPDLERVIERMGRICYQSTHKAKPCGLCRNGWNLSVRCCICGGTGVDIDSARDFIRMVIKNGHESVLEHASVGFSIVTDRGVTHEFVRHRIASFSQESTRYCNYAKEQFGGELTFIEPPGLEGMAQVQWYEHMQVCTETYLWLLKQGTSPQIARSVLPNSLKSEIGVSCNLREWRLFLRLRTSPKAHPQMREVAELIRTELLKLSAACFEDIPR